MAAIAIQSAITDLADSCADHDISRADPAYHAVRDQLPHLTRSDTDLGIAVLLSSPSSLLAIIDMIKSYPAPFDLIRGSLLDLITVIHDLYGVAIRPYANDVIAVCVHLFRGERVHKVRSAALQVVMNLISDENLLDDGSSTDIGLIITTLIDETRSWTKIKSDGVRKMMLETLGALCLKFPGRFSQEQVAFIGNTLAKHLVSPSNLVVEGALIGLSGYLGSFPNTFSEHDTSHNGKSISAVFKVICAILSFDSARFGMPIAALSLISERGHLFRSLFLSHYQNIIDALDRCVSHRNRDLSRAAADALNTIVYQISEAIVTAKEADRVHLKPVYAFVLRRLTAMSPANNPDHYKATAAICGLGLFASAISVFGQSSDLKLCVRDLISWWEQISNISREEPEYRNRRFASYISSISMMIQHISSIDDSVIASLQVLLARVLDVFPNMHSRTRHQTYSAITRLIVVLHGAGSVFHRVLSEVVFHGTAVSVGGARNIDGRQDYQDFVEFWVNIICSDSDEWRIGIMPKLWSVLALARQQLYLLLIQSIEKVISSLNISITEDDAVEETAQPANIPDYSLFLNLVDFCLDLLPKVRPDWFCPLSLQFCRQIAGLLRSFPSVSGLIKLLSCSISICIKQDFFNSTIDSVPEFKSLIRDCAKFSLALISSIEKELLFAYLEFLMIIPSDIVPFDLLLPALKRTFHFGLIQRKFAVLAIETCRNRLSWRDLESTRRNMISLLPNLMDYIQSDTYSNDDRVPIDVLLLIGKLGLAPGAIISGWHKGRHEGMAWDPVNRIALAIPYLTPGAIDLYLDPLLPPICQTALFATNRQDKVSASELLHSIVIKCVCDNARDPRLLSATTEAGKSSPLFQIYQRLFPVVLSLAVDVDPVIQSTYRSLIFQLCHWYTQNIQVRDNESNALLNAVIDAICNESDGALRSLGAHCVREFFHWSLKHIASISSPVPPNIEHLIIRLCELCHRQERGKRIGSCIALSNIYRDFRENDQIVSRFTLRVLKDILFSSCLIEREHIDTQNISFHIVDKALTHYLRIISDPKHGNAALLSRPDSKRTGDDDVENLDSFRQWILSQITRDERHYRMLCMKVLIAIYPQPDLSSALRSWFGSGPGRASIDRNFADNIAHVARALHVQRWVLSNSAAIGPGDIISPVFRDCVMGHVARLVNTRLDGATPIESDFITNIISLLSFLTHSPNPDPIFAIDSYPDLVPLLLLFHRSNPAPPVVLATDIQRILSTCRPVPWQLFTDLTNIDMSSCSLSDLFRNPNAIATASFLIANRSLACPSPQSIARRLLNLLTQAHLQPDQYHPARSILSLSIQLGVPEHDILSILNNRSIGPDLVPNGDRFQTIFSEPIAQYLAIKTSSSFAALLIQSLFDHDANQALRNVLFTALDQVLSTTKPFEPNDRAVVKSLLQSFTDKLSSERVSSSSSGDDLEPIRCQIQFIHRICVWSPAFISDRSAPWLPHIATFITTCMASGANTALAQAIDVLRYLLTVGHVAADPLDLALCESVGKLTRSAPWPQRSVDVPVGSPADLASRSYLTRLLTALRYSRRVQLLNAILGVVRERGHRLRSDIDSTISYIVTSISSLSLSKSEGVHWMNWAGDMFMAADTDYSSVDNAREWIADRILIPLVTHIPITALHLFMAKHCPSLWSLIMSGPGTSIASVLALRSAYHIVTAMVNRLQDQRGSLFTSMGSDLKSICKTCSDHVKKMAINGSISPSIDRSVRSSAYSCLCSMLMSHGSSSPPPPQPLIIAVCLSESPTEPLWSRIIDTTWSPSFTIDTAFSISRSVSGVVPKRAPDRRLHALSNTSLSQDIFSLREESLIVAPSSSDHPAPDPGVPTVIALELDPINALEVMPDMIRLVQYLSDRFPGNPPDHPPQWMDHLHRLMRSNIVQLPLFFIKLILNVVSIFEPFADFWFSDIVRISTSGPVIGGVGFHYFLRDVATMFLNEWSGFIPGQANASQANAFINHCLSVAGDIGQPLSDTSKPVQPEAKLRHNYQLISGLVKKWSSADFPLHLNPFIGYSLLQSKGGATDVAYARSAYMGLSLIELPLLIGLPEYDRGSPSPQVSFDSLNEYLIRCLGHESRIIFNRAATLFGRIFQYESVHQCLCPQRIERLQNVRSLLSSLANQGQSYRYISMIMRIGAICPDFLDDTTCSQILPLAIHSRGQLQVDALKSLIPVISVIEDPFDILLPVINQAQTQINNEVDRSLLMLVLYSVPRIRPDLVHTKLWPLISRYSTHQDVVCRLTFFKTVSAALLNVSSLGKEFSLQLYSAMVSAFGDDSQEIREFAQKFWTDSAVGYTNPSSLLIWLLDLCIGDAFWLSLTVFLLLKACEHSPQFNEVLSPVPLQDSIVFRPVPVDGTWRPGLDSSLTPRFSLSQDPSQIASLPPLLATPDPQFTLTQSIAALDPTQRPDSSSLATIAFNDKTLSEPFEGGQRPGGVRRQRFGAVSTYRSATLAIDKKDKEKREAASARKLVKEAREKSVKVYRSYRDGELPDIQIKRSDILIPLRALHCNHSLSRPLFLMLFRAILSSCSVAHSDTIRLCLSRIITLSFKSSPEIVHSILLASRECIPPVSVPSSSILTVARQNRTIESAILLLEHQIAPVKPLAPFLSDIGSKKRSKSISVSHRFDFLKLGASVESMRCLYDLYETIQDHDMMSSICSRLVHRPETNTALHLMLSGHYHKALHLYDALLNDDPGDAVDDFEVNMWEEGRVDMLYLLGQWHPLHDTIVSAIDEPISAPIWRGLWSSENSFFKEHSLLRIKYINAFQTSARKLPAVVDELREFTSGSMEHLETNPDIAFDLALSLLTINDLPRAKIALDKALNRCLSEWRSLPPFAYSAHSSLLRRLHILTEVHEFFTVSGAESGFIWCSREPQLVQPSESIFLDDLIRNRLLFISRIRSDYGDIGDKLFNCAVDIGISAISIYMKLENLPLARYLLDTCAALDPNNRSLSLLQFSYQLQNAGENKHEVLSDLAGTKFTGEQKLEALLLLAKGYETALDTNRSNHYMDEFAKETLSMIKSSSAQSEYKLAEFLVVYARHCWNILSAESPSPHRSTLRQSLITHTLLAMKLSSSADMFPIALETATEDEAVQDLFIDSLAAIPSWKFLRWRAQILAFLSSSANLMVPTLKRIAADYPHALIYPLELLVQSNASWDENVSKTLRELSRTCNLPLTRRFIQELDRLTFPEHKFRYWAMDSAKLIAKGNMERAVDKYLSFRSSCLPNGSTTPILESFRKGFGRKIDTSFGAAGQKLKTMSGDDVEKACSRIIRNRLGSLESGYMPTFGFSPFLASFAVRNDEYIEVPGQYSGLEMPSPENHARVVSFDPVVYTVRSIRRPKRLVIHGSDEREYSWLVKGGEDLRLDERIQSIFQAMNGFLSKDPACSQRSLSVPTYSVIPMTVSLGLIEWVPNTIAFGKCVEDQLGVQATSAIHESYNAAILKASRSSTNASLVHVYNRLWAQTDDINLLPAFESVVAQVPPNLLSRIITSLCNDVDTFFHVRSIFVKSFTIGAIASYILGLGDRHLDNILIDQKSGQVIPIDFGVAFDHGLQLPIPELVPIRFSFVFQNSLFPLEPSLIYRTMGRCLRVFRAEAQQLLSLMGVFIREPHLDWQPEPEQNPEKSSDSEAKSSAQCDVATASITGQQRLHWAKMKLNGYSSVHIMLSELKCISYPNVAKIMHVIKTAHAGYGDGILSVDDQVKCLLEHAGDPSILARTYQGWRPYI